MGAFCPSIMSTQWVGLHECWPLIAFVAKHKPGWCSEIGVERAMGIEPTSEAWEASILPLNYARPGRNKPSIAADTEARGEVRWCYE